jgi:hypothetical protein
LLGLFENYLSYGGIGFSAEAIADLITLVALTMSFVLFLFLAVRFRHSEGGILGSFKLQLSVAILVWIVGEVFAYTNYLADWSMYLHTCSMALFAIFLAYRFRALLGK